MEKKSKIFLLVFLLLIAGCTEVKDFKYGVDKLSSINSKYKTNMETYPSDLNNINLMIDELTALKNVNLDKEQEQFNALINYRLLNLEAEQLYALNVLKYGNTGTTKKGFGCKGRPFIIESVKLRNSSALNGFDAVDVLKLFVEKYPSNAKSVNLSNKNALFLNAAFYQVSQDAVFDSNVINYFCPENITLSLYQKELMQNSNLSKDYINSLTYENAVKEWKNFRGLN